MNRIKGVLIDVLQCVFGAGILLLWWVSGANPLGGLVNGFGASCNSGGSTNNGHPRIP